jgi:phosphoglycerol geranylgeranyltransferase
MQVEQYLRSVVEKAGCAHLTLIDPASQAPEKGAEIAEAAVAGGTDAIVVGGSTGASGNVLDRTVLSIKEKTDVPVILFPGNAGGLSAHADAVFFMSLLNSRDVNYITSNQVIGAPMVYRSGIEPISMAYLIVEPGGTVGWIGDARLLPRKKPELAVAYALAGKYLGMHFVYLEAGSGADSPIPPEFIGAVKHALGDTMLIVGGGIRDGETAALCARAGADLIVTGTVVENASDVRGRIGEIVAGVRQ